MRTHFGLALALLALLTAPLWLAALELNIGYLELTRGAPDRARVAFAGAERSSISSARASEARGIQAQMTNEYSTAAVFFLEAQARGRVTSLLHWRAARALELAGNPDAALEQDRAAGDALYFFNQARVRRHHKDWIGAERSFLRAAALAPQDAELARALGEFYWEWGKHAAALAPLKRAAELASEPYELHLVQGELAQLQGAWAAAAQQYRSALALDPTRPEVYRRLADLLNEQTEVAAAIALLRQGAVQARSAFGLLLRLGELLNAQGDYAGAAEALRQAELADPRSDEAWLLSAQNNLEWGKVEEAHRDLQQALWLEPNNAETYYWLGRALTRRGQCDQARRAYARAVTLAPDDPRFQTAVPCP